VFIIVGYKLLSHGELLSPEGPKTSLLPPHPSPYPRTVLPIHINRRFEVRNLWSVNNMAAAWQSSIVTLFPAIFAVLCKRIKPLQSNLDYSDSLGPHEIVRIIENMNINEEQNQAKLIKLRKRHLIVKRQFYKSFGIQYRLHFYLSWKERIACALKTWRSWINVRDASFFVFHAIEREISLSNNATLSQSELIWMFFISYEKRERCFCSLRAKKTSHLTAHFTKDMAMDLDRD